MSKEPEKNMNVIDEEELEQVTGGYDPGNPPPPSNRPVDENGKYHCWNCDGICVLIDVPNLPKYQYCPYCKSEFGWR